jgi:hypothetical protein
MLRSKLIFTAGLLVTVTAVVSLSLSLWHQYTDASVATTVLEAPQAAQASTIAGDYVGVVTFVGVYNGVYSDTTVISNTVDLGQIDLALYLEPSGSSVNGFVNLDPTLTFTAEHTIMATPVGQPDSAPQPLTIGPLVKGTFDGTTLSLASESVSMPINEQRTLEDGRILPAGLVTRQFQLITKNVEGNGARLKGEYRETLWGYAAYPTTVIGTFVLQRPVFVAGPGGTYSDNIYMPIISRR